MEKKFAMTYATINALLNNEQVRQISPMIKNAFDAVNSDIHTSGCSSCAKRKKLNDAATSLLSQLQNASDMELDRIKKALGVDKLVFPNGFSAIER
jgi:hypothetical protein